MVEWECDFACVAGRNDGLVARFQVYELGHGADVWARARRSGRWLPVSPRVLRSASAPTTESQALRAAVLDASPGAVPHGRTALAWQGMKGFDLASLQVARVRDVSGMRPTLAQLHQLRALRAHHVVEVRGIVTENALRAIWTEAARYASPQRFEIGLKKIGGLLDQAHRSHLVTWAGLHEMVDDISERGRSGTRIMRILAGERLPGTSPTESRMEERFETVLEESSVRPLRRQIPLGGHEPIGRADYSDDQLPLWTEVNSLLHHTTPTDRASDERRYEASTIAGFMVLVIWEDDLWTNTRAVVALVGEARRRARRGERAVLHSPSCPWPHPRFGAPRDG